MSEKNFKSLARSLREAGEILRGETTDFRQFTGKTTAGRNPATALAICVNTDDKDLLIIGKIYNVKLLENHIAVTDEAGETVICPTDDFLIVSFQPNVEKMLRQLVAA